MSEQEKHRIRDGNKLRVLFCIGVTHCFFEREPQEIKPVVEAIEGGFADLSGRFGLEVLGTIDDDELVVGPSDGWPWTCYILADAPDLDAVRAVTNVIRETEVGSHRLWRYLKIEARIGRRLFFGNE